MDSRCPECGDDQAPLQAAAANQWVDHALVDLWGIAVLMIVGWIIAGISWVFAASMHPMLGMMVAGVALHMLGSMVWFAATAFRFFRQRRQPNFKNVATWRSSQLIRWLVFDLALVLPAIGWAIFRMV